VREAVDRVSIVINHIIIIIWCRHLLYKGWSNLWAKDINWFASISRSSRWSTEGREGSESCQPILPHCSANMYSEAD
jgi:hypothetical protein